MQTKLESLYDFATKKPNDYAGYTKDTTTKQASVFRNLHGAVKSILTEEQIEKQLEVYESKENTMHYNGKEWQYTATKQHNPLGYRAAAACILWHILYSYVADNYDSASIKTQLVRIAGRTVVNYFY